MGQVDLGVNLTLPQTALQPWASLNLSECEFSVYKNGDGGDLSWITERSNGSTADGVCHWL
jgi:hypothetical protein